MTLLKLLRHVAGAECNPQGEASRCHQALTSRCPTQPLCEVGPRAAQPWFRQAALSLGGALQRQKHQKRGSNVRYRKQRAPNYEHGLPVSIAAKNSGFFVLDRARHVTSPSAMNDV
jgi:hypothetical protein